MTCGLGLARDWLGRPFRGARPPSPHEPRACHAFLDWQPLPARAAVYASRSLGATTTSGPALSLDPPVRALVWIGSCELLAAVASNPAPGERAGAEAKAEGKGTNQL